MKAFELNYAMTSFEISKQCVHTGYHKFVPHTFNGKLQRKLPENFGKREQM